MLGLVDLPEAESCQAKVVERQRNMAWIAECASGRAGAVQLLPYVLVEQELDVYPFLLRQLSRCLYCCVLCV